MKIRITIYIGILLLIPVLMFGQWWSNGEWVEYECAICAKPVYVWYEGRMEPYMPSVTFDGQSELWPPKEEANEIYIGKPIYLCKTDYERYNSIFQELIISLINEKHKENIGLVKKHRKEKHLRNIEDKKQQIEALESQLKELKK